MTKLSHFNRLVEKFGSVVDFQIFYIQEAHPDDGWAFRNNTFVIRYDLRFTCSVIRSLSYSIAMLHYTVKFTATVSNHLYEVLTYCGSLPFSN